MQTIKHTTLAAVLLSLFLASANAQIPTAPAKSSLSAEVTAAHTQIVKELATLVNKDVVELKTAVAALEVNRAAGVSVAGDVATVEAARAQLRADQHALADASKVYFSAVRLALKVDQSRLKADVTASLDTINITID
jgi:cystathionine beta-lyase/cystathionine gamma-synthase